MAVSQTGGVSGNSSAAVSSLALASYTSHSGQDVLVAVTLGSTASSVSSIATSAGTYGAPVLKASINGTGMRVELWTVHVTTGAATVFTVNITGGATTIAVALEEYSGVSSFGNTGTNSGSGLWVRGSATTQDGNNFTVSVLGFSCQSGDTLSASLGNSRQSSIPAATAVGGAIYDNTMVPTGIIVEQGQLNNSRNWATATVEMRSGGAAITAADYAATTAPSLEVYRDFRYLRCFEPLFAQAQTYPPTPGANNYGFVA